MIARCVSGEILQQALDKVNKEYGNNIRFERFEKLSNSRGGGETWAFTLRPKNSRGPGGRISAMALVWEGRIKHVNAACWHVHGEFFDNLLDIEPKARITATGNQKIYKDGSETIGNWNDQNIGSIISPVYWSEACHCNGGY